MSYKFDRLSGDNLHHLVTLYKDCFKVKISYKFLQKKYDTLIFGAEYIGYLAFDKVTNEVAGYYGVFPLRGFFQGKEMLVAQSGDTMTHPKHQGRGLFTTLAKLTYELAEREGIEFVFGFPNKNSYPGFKRKLDWVFYNDINNYSIKASFFPLDKIAKRNSIFNYFYNRYLRIMLGSILTTDIFSNSIEKENPSSGYIVHDQNFFNYKGYYEFYKVKINQTLCLIKIDGRLWVGDIDSCSIDQFRIVIDGLVLLAKRLGCSSVHFNEMNMSFKDEILSKKYKLKSKNPVGFIKLKEGIEPSEFSYVAFDFDTY